LPDEHSSGFQYFTIGILCPSDSVSDKVETQSMKGGGKNEMATVGQNGGLWFGMVGHCLALHRANR
jgi:hypothetical protein